jgi:hypothetical protein
MTYICLKLDWTISVFFDDIYCDLIKLVPDGGRDGHIDGRVVSSIAVQVRGAGQLINRIAQDWLLLALV